MEAAIPRVLHASARPISIYEFAEAIRATCRPRFPNARPSKHRPIGIAVSGGVDSMCLAYLFANLKRADPFIHISDNPIGKLHAFVVDHGYREGSTQEAEAVRSCLVRKFELKTTLTKINWGRELGWDVDVKTIPNFESAARRARFRRLGALCAYSNIASLFLAHHEDDQYETVLMRLLQGHGPAGLRGMRPATDIPECHDMFGAYGSGFVDDQASDLPFWNHRPTGRVSRSLRKELKAEVDLPLLDMELRSGGNAARPDHYLDDESDSQLRGTRWLPRLGSLDIEDGGVMIYRPLLEFSKDRMIATCLENNIPWFEDATNQDATLTMRNAVRHLHQNYQLPVALQKPAVLQLAKRCDHKAKSKEAEADRLLERTVIRDFDTIVGSVVVRLPTINPGILRRRSRYAAARQEVRRDHYRSIAALLVRRLLSLVTPEYQVTPTSNLQQVVKRLFPYLEHESQGEPVLAPKGFNICGVHFQPVQTSKNGPLNWYLTREPYSSNQPLPRIRLSATDFGSRWRRRPDNWPWPASAGRWRLWDGRYWVRYRHRLAASVVVAPFQAEHGKLFRESLADDSERDLLAALLKRHAPGKVRYTLPAIYVLNDIDFALQGGDYWRTMSAKEPKHFKEVGDDEIEEFREDLQYDREKRDTASMRLVALPTLGIHLPRIDQWIQWTIRYRKIDPGILEKSASLDRELVRRTEIVRAAHMAWRRSRRRTSRSHRRHLGTQAPLIGMAERG